MHFNAIRELGDPFAVGMCKGTSVERCTLKHSKRNLVSGVRWGAARHDW